MVVAGVPPGAQIFDMLQIVWMQPHHWQPLYATCYGPGISIPAAFLFWCTTQDWLIQCMLRACLAGQGLLGVALPPLSICTVIIHTGRIRVCAYQHLGRLRLLPAE